ncbi:CFF_collapsed_G0026170.mRNA.1.CDS.1 [Saccharomyces cerevisiae]|nr:CFF_collapsed_G0026170.mRNA.1.CDS.1 [Saccharomyces cerevisiae]
MNAKRHARDFLAQYGYMVENQTSLPFLRLTRTDVMILPSISLTVWVINSNISLQTISEAESAGANTLSAHHSCRCLGR